MNNKYNMTGIVRIYDENNNLIQEKHNMIVEEGRKKILNVMFGTETKPDFKYFYETGASTQLTTPDMKMPTNYAAVTNVKHELKIDNISITYTATIEYNNETNPILAVGLFWNDKEGNHLFSRAAIDPIYMNENRKYTVEHTIYL